MKKKLTKRHSVENFVLTCFNVKLCFLKMGPNKSGVQAVTIFSSCIGSCAIASLESILLSIDLHNFILFIFFLHIYSAAAHFTAFV